MGRSAPPVGIERGWNFGDTPAGKGGLDHQLARELHARRPEIERHDRLPVEAAQPAVEVAHSRAKEESPDEAQHRVAEVAMQWRHRARTYPAFEPVPHDQGVPRAQALDECIQSRKI